MSTSLLRIVVPFLRRASLGCCLLLFLHPPSATAQEISPAARKHFELARQAQDAGSFDKATQEYLATIRLEPGFAGAYSNLGLVYYVQGNFKDSAAALSKSLRLQPNLIGANLYLGIDNLKLNHPAQAVPLLQHATQLDPANKDAQSWLGTAYWESGQIWTALEQLRETDKKFPNDPDILFVLGEAYRKTADREIETLLHDAGGTAFAHQIYGDIYLDQHSLAKASAHYQRAFQQDPTAPEIHFELGETALQEEHFKAAEDEYRKQLQATPSHAPSMARLAELSLLNGDISASLQLLQQAIVLSPSQAASTLRLPPSFATTGTGLSDLSLQQLRAAQPAVAQAPPSPARALALAFLAASLESAENFQVSWAEFQSTRPSERATSSIAQRARQHFDEQRFDQSEDEIHAWLVLHPHDLEARYLAARCHRMLSLQVLDRLLSGFPDSYRSHQLLAQTYVQRDEDEKAVAEYKKVEEIAPTLPGIHFALAHLLAQNGDLEQASAQLREELRLDPENPQANAEMGLTLLAEGQASAAVPYLTRATSLQPDLWIAHQELGKAYLQQKDYTAAQRELTLALHEDPEGIAHYQLGLVYKALGQTQDAAREFDASRKIKSDRLSAARIEMPSEGKNE